MSTSYGIPRHNYAGIVVKAGFVLQTSQRLIVRAPVKASPLVHLIAACAYQVGAPLVDIICSDTDFDDIMAHAIAEPTVCDGEWSYQL